MTPVRLLSLVRFEIANATGEVLVQPLLRNDSAPAGLGAIVFPLGVAGLTVPGGALDGNWDAEEGAHVGNGAVEFLKAYVERVAFRTARLLVEADALNVEAFEDGFVEDGAGVGFVGGANVELDASDEVRDEPVETDEIFVGQKTFDAGRFEAAFGEQGLGEIAELANGDQFAKSEGFARFGGGFFFREFEVAAVEFVFESVPGEFGERFGVAGELLQFAIGHGGVVGLETAFFALGFEEGLAGVGHLARILLADGVGQLGGFSGGVRSWKSLPQALKRGIISTA
jgi:hypothetical protein